MIFSSINIFPGRESTLNQTDSLQFLSHISKFVSEKIRLILKNLSI
ncbi:hypothetical protein MXB_517 [Myxobolus squamalis]|nr:hypothetical protein MXB_517 [Myxobolus squamalis]